MDAVIKIQNHKIHTVR